MKKEIKMNNKTEIVGRMRVAQACVYNYEFIQIKEDGLFKIVLRNFINDKIVYFNNVSFETEKESDEWFYSTYKKEQSSEICKILSDLRE